MPTARAAGFAFSVLVVALALPAIAGAADGSLSVTVRDSYGVIPRAAVRATSAATGASQRVVTDDEGVARFAALPAGRYEVRAAFPGFADTAEPAVALAEGEAKSLELVMGVAQLSTTPHHRDREPARAAAARRGGAGDSHREDPDRGHRRPLREGRPRRAERLRHPGERGRRPGLHLHQRDPEQGGARPRQRPALPRQGRERQPEPRGAAPARHPAHRGGEGRGLGALRVGRARRRRELHHRRADRAWRHEHHHRLRRFLRRLPGGRRAVVARQPGRGEPRRRLPDLRRLRPRVLHAGAAGRRRAASRTRRRSASPRAPTGTPRAPPTSRSRRRSWPASSATTSCARSATTSSPGRPSSPPPSTTPSAT